MRVNLQPAYLLHSRAYRDTSQILELFTAEYGLLSIVGRGVKRRAPGGSAAAVLQAFRPLLVSYSGRSELKTLVAAEAAPLTFTLSGEQAFSGLYLNELLLRVLHRHDPHPQLFARYGETLESLAKEQQVAASLRRFEYALLTDLGYGFELAVDAQTGAAVVPGAWYHYVDELGLVERPPGSASTQPAFAGEDLLALAGGHFERSPAATAKRLLRAALAPLLGDRPLHSRELFRQFRGGSPAGPRPAAIDNHFGEGET